MGMSIWQLKRQLAFLAAAAGWVESPSNVIYTGGAVISEDLEGNFSPGSFLLDGPQPNSLPFARVSCVDWLYDIDQPSRMWVANLRLFSTAGGGSPYAGVTAVAAPGFDTHGINMETAALRNAQGKSDGRSVEELISRFIESLPAPAQAMFTENVHGFQGRAVRGHGMIPQNGVQVLSRAVDVEVTNPTTSNHYHAPTHVHALGGTVTWRNPPTRYDTFKNELWRGANSGDPAPTTRTGHQVTLGSNMATTGVDTPGAGIWNYAVFTTYTETPSAVLAAVADRASIGTPANTVTI